MTIATPTYSKNIGRRLIKNSWAFAGMVFIVLAIFVALLGYLIAPDNSPFADFQTIELQAKNPGYTQLFLKIPEGLSHKISLPEKIIYGTPVFCRLIPITQYKIEGNTLITQKYVDEDTSVLQLFDINEITKGHPKDINQLLITKKYLLGTDVLGRDILSRLIIGTRVSLTVGLIAVLISLLVGIFLGAIAGFYRGRIDAFVMWLINVTWSIPTLLLVFALTLLMGKGFWQIFTAVGLTMWVGVARLVRGQVMAIRELEYIEAVRTMGFSDWRIIWKHILPNMLGPLMVIAAGNFASAIIIEAGLSFLGIGIQPPQPSWGLMIKENYNFILTNRPLLALIPGIAIMLLVLAFNLLGNGLRDAVDVKNK